MFRLRRFPHARSVAILLGVALRTLAEVATPATEELRGLWVDSFHPGLRSEAEIRELVHAARIGGFNALFVEVRKRGDAYYDSRYEPRATDLEPGLDPLQRLLELAHDPDNGPRLAIHAWIVAFNIWGQESIPPPQPDHPYRLHPEWLTRSAAGATWDGYHYAFDPGHPEVQRHTFRVAMDLIRRYDLDGLHWDYIRYSGKDWGYNDVAVERFNTLNGRTGKPGATDPGWLQFRRDQVTALVRKVYLEALALKPRLTISAATITFAPGIVSTPEWSVSAAYSDVLQDWRAWTEEGILDWNLPMTYFRQSEYAEAFVRWTSFVADHQYRRRAAPGLAFYLNSVSQTLQQIERARSTAPQGGRATGLLAYSYASLATDAARDEMLAALTHPSRHSSLPPFAHPAVAPTTPWKTSNSTGHLKGLVIRSADQTAIDGARVQLSGPVERQLTTDATGFFGAVDLPPGGYQVQIQARGWLPTQADAAVEGGRVAHLEFSLVPVGSAEPGRSLEGQAPQTARVP